MVRSLGRVRCARAQLGALARSEEFGALAVRFFSSVRCAPGGQQAAPTDAPKRWSNGHVPPDGRKRRGYFSGILHSSTKPMTNSTAIESTPMDELPVICVKMLTKNVPMTAAYLPKMSKNP